MSAARPVRGAIVGALIGIVVVIIVQQVGAWPADRLAVFGAIGLFGLVGALLASVRRKTNRVLLIVVVILLLLSLVWAVLGADESLNGTGSLSGGCTVAADSYGATGGFVDSISDPSETSAQDPFDVDANGSVDWEATSPAPIKNYSFEIGVDVGGVKVPLDSESNTNADLNTENSDTESVAEYLGVVTDATGIEIRGVYNVSGSISGEGGTCSGNGFVRIPSDGLFDGPIAIGAWILLVILLIILIIVIVSGRRRGPSGSKADDVLLDEGPPGGPGSDVGPDGDLPLADSGPGDPPDAGPDDGSDPFA